MADEFRVYLEKINDVLKQEPSVKSFLGAARHLGAIEVTTVAEAIAVLKEKPDTNLIVKFSGVTREQRDAMAKEIQEFRKSQKKKPADDPAGR